MFPTPGIPERRTERDHLIHGFRTSYQGLRLGTRRKSAIFRAALVKAQGSTGQSRLETVASRNGPASWSKTLWFSRFFAEMWRAAKNGRGRETVKAAPERERSPDVLPAKSRGNAGFRSYERRESFEG